MTGMRLPQGRPKHRFQDGMIPRRLVPYSFLATVLCLVYFAAGKLGLKLAFVNASASAVWPPTGIALAAFLVLGYRVWPAIFLGAFLVNVTTAGTIATSMRIAGGNTLEGLLGAYLVTRYANGPRAFERTTDIVKFAALAGIIGTMVSATLGVTSLSMAGFASWSNYKSIWFTWWLGDAAGACIVAPMLVLWSQTQRLNWRHAQYHEAVILLLATCVLGAIAFGESFASATKNYPLEFICFPPIVWAAFRFGQREAATTSLLVSGIAIWGTLRGFGPFVRSSANESLLLLQGFMGVASFTGIFLASVVSELRAARAELQLITDTMSAAVSRCSRHERYLWVSPRYAAWLGQSTKQISGHAIVDVLGREGYATIQPFIHKVLAGERTEYEAQVNFSGIGQRWIHAVYEPTYDQNKNVDGWVAHVSDITALKQAEAEVARMTLDLQRSNASLAISNEDLERFAFIASHDLQEPLRMITTYSQLLVKSFSGQLDKNANMFVAYIVEGTKRMRELLADLLAYTEIGAHTEEPSEAVDLNVIVSKVIQNLKASIEETGSGITCDPLPTLCANAAHFTSLFQNLIANAIKYRGQQPPRIHISAKEAPGQIRFTVADNGIGIDPQYHEQIFEVFKRLHGQNIPGTGVGLAICQRVVERYSGRIWVESRGGDGATFVFTLPSTHIHPGAAVCAAGENRQ